MEFAYKVRRTKLKKRTKEFDLDNKKHRAAKNRGFPFNKRRPVKVKKGKIRISTA